MTRASKQDQLELRYVPLETVDRWEQNPKLHSLSGIIESISRYGFGDPPKYDGKLKALVYGNGRIEALTRMHADGSGLPRGVLDNGDGWLVPVIFGVDQASVEAAERFALDHNSLTLGPSFDTAAVTKLWSAEELGEVAKRWRASTAELVVPLPKPAVLISAGGDDAAIRSILQQADEAAGAQQNKPKAKKNAANVATLVFDNGDQVEQYRAMVARLRKIKGSETIMSMVILELITKEVEAHE